MQTGPSDAAFSAAFRNQHGLHFEHVVFRLVQQFVGTLRSGHLASIEICWKAGIFSKYLNLNGNLCIQPQRSRNDFALSFIYGFKLPSLRQMSCH